MSNTKVELTKEAKECMRWIVTGRYAWKFKKITFDPVDKDKNGFTTSWQLIGHISNGGKKILAKVTAE